MERNLILVVDDEKDICAELSIFLSKKGYNVVLANNFPDAVELFRLRKPMLVITDYHMPGETGVDLLRKIKSIDKHVYVILMSGVADARVAATAMKEDAFDFLSKPINLDELESVVTNAMERAIQGQSRDTKAHKKADFMITHDEINRGKIISIMYFNVNLDQYSADKYKTAFMNYLNIRTINDHIIIDLKYVTYINNIGLNLLIYIAELLNDRKKKFIICNLSHSLMNYIYTLGYATFLNVENTLEDAIGKI